MTQGSDTREQEVAELGLFEEARRALQSFTAAKEELLWRITHRLKTADKTRKAVEQLIATASLVQFQSRADDCASDYAAARQDNAFPGCETPIDVLYGRSLHPAAWISGGARGYLTGRRCARADGAILVGPA